MALTTKFRTTPRLLCHSPFLLSHSPGLSPVFHPSWFVYIPSERTRRPSLPFHLACLCYRIMVAFGLIFRISTIFLALDTALASHQTLVRRAVDGLHLEAARRTHSLAKDLRIAFGGILPRAVSSSQPGHVYCKLARQVPLQSNGGSNGTSSSMSIIGTRTRTRTTTKGPPTSTKSSTSSSPTVSSAWRLTETHVRMPFVGCLVYPAVHLILQSGSNFFDGWDFFTGADPTHGSFPFFGYH
jgi:hypothetical protein